MVDSIRALMVYVGALLCLQLAACESSDSGSSGAVSTDASDNDASIPDTSEPPFCEALFEGVVKVAETPVTNGGSYIDYAGSMGNVVAFGRQWDLADSVGMVSDTSDANCQLLIQTEVVGTRIGAGFVSSATAVTCFVGLPNASPRLVLLGDYFPSSSDAFIREGGRCGDRFFVGVQVDSESYYLLTFDSAGGNVEYTSVDSMATTFCTDDTLWIAAAPSFFGSAPHQVFARSEREQRESPTSVGEVGWTTFSQPTSIEAYVIGAEAFRNGVIVAVRQFVEGTFNDTECHLQFYPDDGSGATVLYTWPCSDVVFRADPLRASSSETYVVLDGELESSVLRIDVENRGLQALSDTLGRLLCVDEIGPLFLQSSQDNTGAYVSVIKRDEDPGSVQVGVIRGDAVQQRPACRSGRIVSGHGNQWWFRRDDTYHVLETLQALEIGWKRTTCSGGGSSTPSDPTALTSISAIQTSEVSLSCPDPNLQFVNGLGGLVVRGTVVVGSHYLADNLDGYIVSDGSGNPFSSILVAVNSNPKTDFRVADVLEIEGQHQEFFCNTQLRASTIRKTGTAATIPNPTILPKNPDQTSLEGSEGALVEMYNVVAYAYDSGARAVLTDAGVGIDYGIMGPTAFASGEKVAGRTFLRIRGVVRFSRGSYRISPRNLDDLTASDDGHSDTDVTGDADTTTAIDSSSFLDAADVVDTGPNGPCANECTSTQECEYCRTENGRWETFCVERPTQGCSYACKCAGCSYSWGILSLICDVDFDEVCARECKEQYGCSGGEAYCELTPPPCVRNCDGQQCGDDGCGGSCGYCRPTEACMGGMCIWQQPNGECERPYLLTDDDSVYHGYFGTGDTSDGSNLLDATSCRPNFLSESGLNAPDDVWLFFAPTRGNYRVTVTPSGDTASPAFDPMFYVLDWGVECDGVCEFYTNNGGPGEAESAVLSDVQGDLRIVVDGVSGTQGPYSLTVVYEW